MRILIAGCGYVGSVLGRQLQGAGHQVLGLRRTPRGDEGFPVQALDLLGTWTVADLPWRPQGVVYAVSAGETTDEAYRAAYVEGPRRLLRELSASSAPVERWLLVSSTGVYGQQDGAWVDETSTTEPQSFTGRRLLEGEAVVRGAAFRSTILRLGGIYGPGRTRLIDSVRQGTARRRAGTYSNRIHRDDAAAAAAWLLTQVDGEHLQQVYLGVDDEPADLDEVMTWLARRLGVEPPTRVEEESASAAPGPRGGGGRRGNKRCSNRRLRATGFELRYPSYREGYGALLDA